MTDTVKAQMWFEIGRDGTVQLRSWGKADYESDDVVHGPYLVEVPVPDSVSKAIAKLTIPASVNG